MTKIIGVVGGAHCSSEIYKLAVEVGERIAKNGNILICGGGTGVMEAACKGAKNEKGVTIGVLPGRLKSEANRWVDMPIVTGMGLARNAIIIRSSDVIIAIDGSCGTLSELAIACNLGVSIVGLKTWEVDLPIERVNTPQEAVELAIKLSNNPIIKSKRNII